MSLRLCLFALLLGWLGARSAQGQTFSVELGPEEPVMRSEAVLAERCSTSDFPDAYARAFVDADGHTQLIVGSAGPTYRSIGDNLSSVARSCPSAILVSDHDPTPRQYNDYEWLVAPYTLDGTTIYSLVHNEYHGWEHDNCPVEGVWPPACTWAAVTLVKSTDKGVSYQHNAPWDPPNHVVGSLPFDYAPLAFSGTTFPGYREPSNIIQRDGYFYVFVTVATGTLVDGVYQRYCLLRTDEAGLSDPTSWRAFDGTGFSQPVNGQLCQNVLGGGKQVSYNSYFGRYMTIGFCNQGFCARLGSTPTTLTSWGPAATVLDTRLPWVPASPQDPDSPWRSYPSFLQPGDPTRNFERTGRSPYLYYTYATPEMLAKEDPPAYTKVYRDLYRRRVRFSLPGEESTYDVLSLEMNEYRGGVTLDSSFYGNDGTLQTGVSWSAERASGPRALRFAAGAQLTVPHQASLDLQGSLTIEAFIRLLALDQTNFAQVVSKDAGGLSGRNYGLYIPPQSNPCAGKLHFSFSGGMGFSGSCGKRRVDDGRWHHVAVTYSDSDKTARYYIDGRLDVEAVHGDALGAGVNSAPVAVGAGLDGILDSVRIYNYPRSAAQILAEAQGSGNVELCNGLDDDGDGAPDNGLPCVLDTTETQGCPGTVATRSRSCLADCSWGDWDSCPPTADAGSEDSGSSDSSTANDSGVPPADATPRDVILSDSTTDAVAWGDAVTNPTPADAGCSCQQHDSSPAPLSLLLVLLMAVRLRKSWSRAR